MLSRVIWAPVLTYTLSEAPFPVSAGGIGCALQLGASVAVAGSRAVERDLGALLVRPRDLMPSGRGARVRAGLA